MEIIKDPQEVKRFAKQREDENQDFRAWIKGHGPDDDELNALVQKLSDEVWAKIDCALCANCCRVTNTNAVPDEFASLAQALNMSIQEFKDKVLRFDHQEKSWILPCPCPLLDGNLCRVYDDRPLQCRDYPNLDANFRSHSLSRIANAEICPIVFNVIEALKHELRWPGLKRWRERARPRR